MPLLVRPCFIMREFYVFKRVYYLYIYICHAFLLIHPLMDTLLNSFPSYYCSNDLCICIQYISLRSCSLLPLGYIYPVKWKLVDYSAVSIFEERPYVLHCMYQFTLPPIIGRYMLISTFFSSLMMATLTGEVLSHPGLIWHFPDD